MGAALKTIKRGESRFYVDPETREKVPGVTSVIDMVPKNFLTFWAAKETAEWAADNLGAVVSLLLNGQRQAAVDTMKAAHRRTTGAAAETGTEVHVLFEKLARGQRVGRQHPEMEPYVRHINEFLDRYQPEFLFIEESVWSDQHKYAGSFDALVRIEGETVMLDAKSTRSGVHPEVALQLSAYSHADRIVTQDGAHAELPTVDAGAVLHLRPEAWQLVPARVDDDVFAYFLILRQVFDWVRDVSGTVLGAPLYRSGETTGAERRASRPA
ncbi:hypothetical protein JOD54_000820 [Actinokineospora baliensis]|uniref:hypothetical protein n=1 Tax=Actinokineospora baliensis TaxID=547056 RepID=UPI00195A8BB1|nr:hypothetical protein [Actinokineospora baliensis]MBM7770616.1 hypothetical protein [Actinokineospora baliensis]